MSICCVCQCTQLHTYLQQCWVSNERKPIFSIVRSVMEVQRCQTKKASNWCCVWLQLCDNFQLSSNMNRTPRWSLCMGWNVRKPIPKLYLLRKLFSSQLCSEYQTIWLRMSQSLGSANGHWLIWLTFALGTSQSPLTRSACCLAYLTGRGWWDETFHRMSLD